MPNAKFDQNLEYFSHKIDCMHRVTRCSTGHGTSSDTKPDQTDDLIALADSVRQWISKPIFSLVLRPAVSEIWQ